MRTRNGAVAHNNNIVAGEERDVVICMHHTFIFYIDVIELGLGMLNA